MPMPHSVDDIKAILTPSEAMAFQNFLSSVDSMMAPEWLMYSGKEAGAGPTITPSEGSAQPQSLAKDTTPSSKEALVKATRDLLSLDANQWARDSYHHAYEHGLYGPRHEYTPQLSTQALGAANAVSSSSSSSSQPPHLSTVRSHLLSGPLPINPLTSTSPTTIGVPSALDRFSSYSLSAIDTNSSLPSSHALTSPSVSPTTSIRPDSRDVSSTVNKRPRAATVATTTQTTSKQKAIASKPALLSPSQKKANHIQSEQKRRANIRRGYDSLCETVPALREAILQEEREQAEKEKDKKGKGRMNGTSRNGNSTASARRGSKSDFNDDITGASETRAGPRSESVVLQKTIEYIQELRSERETLMLRLQQLPPLPAGCLSSGPPLWEREWTGGQGKYEADDDDEGEDS